MLKLNNEKTVHTPLLWNYSKASINLKCANLAKRSNTTVNHNMFFSHQYLDVVRIRELFFASSHWDVMWSYGGGNSRWSISEKRHNFFYSSESKKYQVFTALLVLPSGVNFFSCWLLCTQIYPYNSKIWSCLVKSIVGYQNVVGFSVEHHIFVRKLIVKLN